LFALDKVQLIKIYSMYAIKQLLYFSFNASPIVIIFIILHIQTHFRTLIQV